MPEIA
jgi:hypothetical protein